MRPWRFIQTRAAPTPAQLQTCTGAFQFGSDFYQPNAKLQVAADGNQLSLHWPGGSISWLIPVDRDQFIDRWYWEEVSIRRDAAGTPATLVYDRFQGAADSAR
jgi:hypothetical protein